jgi:aspartate aminotransferase-like enzyme
MLRKPRLFTPGPTPLSPRVREALGRDIPHHRSEEFRALFRECRVLLQRFLKTSHDVLLLSSSGSGAMETAVVNVLSPGDRMLACVAGSFGQRWADIGRAHGMNVTVLEAPWGEAVAPAVVSAALDRDPGLRAVFVQHSESSTGVRHDVAEMGRIVRAREDVVLVVDAISGAGAMPLESEAWGLDVVVVGSQKSLALPPGLAFVAVSSKAWKRVESSGAPRFYFDLLRERKGQDEGMSACTPAISHVVALREALHAVSEMGGVDALVGNAATLAAMTRAAAAALGQGLTASPVPSAAAQLRTTGVYAHVRHPIYSALLAGGTALYLATFGFTRWAMFRLVSWTRLIAAAGVLVFLPVAIVLPALAALAVLAAGVAALNVVEYARVEKIGWRALLARRDREQSGAGSGP